MSLFKRLFGSKTAPARVLAAFAATTRRTRCGSPVIMVGDYVDRGDDSAGVLRTLFARRDDPKLICLTGNHEEMLLSFLDQPV